MASDPEYAAKVRAMLRANAARERGARRTDGVRSRVRGTRDDEAASPHGVRGRAQEGQAAGGEGGAPVRAAGVGPPLALRRKAGLPCTLPRWSASRLGCPSGANSRLRAGLPRRLERPQPPGLGTLPPVLPRPKVLSRPKVLPRPKVLSRPNRTPVTMAACDPLDAASTAPCPSSRSSSPWASRRVAGRRPRRRPRPGRSRACRARRDGRPTARRRPPPPNPPQVPGGETPGATEPDRTARRHGTPTQTDWGAILDVLPDGLPGLPGRRGRRAAGRARSGAFVAPAGVDEVATWYRDALEATGKSTLDLSLAARGRVAGCWTCRATCRSAGSELTFRPGGRIDDDHRALRGRLRRRRGLTSDEGERAHGAEDAATSWGRGCWPWSCWCSSCCS